MSQANWWEAAPVEGAADDWWSTAPLAEAKATQALADQSRPAVPNAPVETTWGEFAGGQALNVAQGVMRAPKALTDLASELGIPGAQSGSDFFNRGIESAEYFKPDAFKQEAQQGFVEYDAEGNMAGLQLPSAEAGLGDLLSSIPQIPQFLVGGGMLRTGASKLPLVGPKLATALGYGSANAALVAPGQAQDTRAEALELGMPQEQADDAALKALLGTGALTAITGGAGGLLSGLSGSTASSLPTALLRGYLAEAPFEGGEEFGQSIIGDAALGRDPNLPAALDAGLRGAAAGGLPGSAIAGLEYVTARGAPPVAVPADSLPPDSPIPEAPAILDPELDALLKSELGIDPNQAPAALAPKPQTTASPAVQPMDGQPAPAPSMGDFLQLAQQYVGQAMQQRTQPQAQVTTDISTAATEPQAAPQTPLRQDIPAPTEVTNARLAAPPALDAGRDRGQGIAGPDRNGQPLLGSPEARADAASPVAGQADPALAKRAVARKTEPNGKPRDLLRVLAYGRGLDRADFQRRGIDPAEFSRRVAGRPVFRKQGGMTLSELREFMQQETYLPRDPDGAPPTVGDDDALNAFDRAWRGGESVYSMDQGDAVARYEQARREADEAYRAEIEADDDGYSDEIARLVEWAQDAGIPAGEVDAVALSAANDEAHYSGLSDLIARYSRERENQGTAPGSDAGRVAPSGTDRGNDDGFDAFLDGPSAEFDPSDPFIVRQQQGLFPPARPDEEVAAEQRRRDDARNGRDATGRTDMAAGEGELFAGPRPEQAQIESSRDMFVPTRGEQQEANRGQDQDRNGRGNNDPRPDSAGRNDADGVRLRPDGSPGLTRRAKFAIESLVRRFDGSVLADTIARDFQETGSTELVGKTIRSIEDLAVAAQVYRNPIFEVMRYVFVNNAGKVVGETAVSARMPASSPAFPAGVSDASWIKQQMAEHKAAGVYLIHNHPSGNPMPSAADRAMTAHAGRSIGAGLKGHVVLNHQTYGFINRLGESPGVVKLPNPPASDPLREFRGLTLGKTIDGPPAAAVVGADLFKLLPENSAAIVTVGARNEITSAVTLPINALRGNRGAALLAQIGKRGGAIRNFAVLPYAKLAELRQPVQQAMRAGLIRDAMFVPDDGPVYSMAASEIDVGSDFDELLGRRGRLNRGVLAREGGAKAGDASIVRSPVSPYSPQSPAGDGAGGVRQKAEQRAETRRNEAADTLAVSRGTPGWNYDRGQWDGRTGMLNRTRRSLQDKMLAWRDAQNQLEAQGAIISDASNVYRLENLMHGRVGTQMDALERDTIEPLMKAISDAGVTPEQLEQYLYARHAEERNQYVASINPKMPDGGSGMATAEAKKILAAASPKMTALAARVDRITKANRKRVLDAGLITQEQFDALEQQYEFYVPLRGENDAEFENASTGQGRGMDTRPSPIKRAMGRGIGNPAKNVLAEVIGDAQRAIILSEKARVGRAVMRLVLQNPNPALWTVEPVQVERDIDVNGQVYERITRDMSDPSIIAVRHKGQLYAVKIENEPLARALNHVGVDSMHPVFRALGMVNRYFSAILTRYNPAFVPVNASRDMIFGLTGLATEHGELAALQAVKEYPLAARAAWRHSRGTLGDSQADRYAQEFADAGGKTGMVHMPSVEDLAGKLGGKSLTSFINPTAYNARGAAAAAKALGNFIENANDAVENALRLSAYIVLRKRGMSAEKAAEYAKNLTVNFNRKGEQGAAANALFLFFNAAMQGAHRTGKVLRKPKAWAYLGGMAAFQSAMTLLAMGMEDDEGENLWNKIPDHIKRRAIVLPIDGDSFLTIPMPYGFNVFTYGAGQLAEAMTRDTKAPEKTGAELAGNLMAATAEAFLPIPIDDGPMGLVPTLIRLPANVQNNRDGLGRSIRADDTYNRDGMPRFTLAKPDTLEIYKLTAEGLNLISGGDEYSPGLIDRAPEDLEYLVSELTGGPGRVLGDSLKLAVKATDAGAEVKTKDVPVLNRFLSGVDEQASQQSLFYDRKAALERDLDRVRDAYKRDGEKGAKALMEAMPTLGGVRFKRYKTNGRSSGSGKVHVRGQMIVGENGFPQFEAAPGSLFKAYKEANEAVTDRNSLRREAFAEAPASLLPNRARDAKLREADNERMEAKRKFNAAWTRAMSE